MKYIEEILDEIISASQSPESKGAKSGHNLFSLFAIIASEIERLDVLAFEPSIRAEFAFLRQRYRALGNKGIITGDETRYFISLSNRMKTLLSSYGVGNTIVSNRSFDFIIDAELKSIIERDYNELSMVLIPDKAWKSAVIIAGSILEAVLFDVLNSSRFYTIAMNSTKAPTLRGSVIDLHTEDWKLYKLIEVSVDINILPASRANSIDQILRDYRNFVHPRKELRAQYSCDEAEAFLAKGALDSVLNHLKAEIFP